MGAVKQLWLLFLFTPPSHDHRRTLYFGSGRRKAAVLCAKKHLLCSAAQDVGCHPASQRRCREERPHGLTETVPGRKTTWAYRDGAGRKDHMGSQRRCREERPHGLTATVPGGKTTCLYSDRAGGWGHLPRAEKTCDLNYMCGCGVNSNFNIQR